MKDVTPKQLTILYVLILALILVVSLKYLIMPAYDTKDKAQKEYNDTKASYSELQIQGNYASVYQQRNDDLKKKISELSEGFLSNVKPEDIDSYVTGLIVGRGIKIVDMHLGDIVDYKPTISSEDTTNSDGTTTSDNAGATTSTTTTTNQENTDGENKAPSSHVRCSTLNITSEGTYEKLASLINTVKSTNGLSISGVTFSTGSDDKATDGLSVTFDVTVYMYVDEDEADTKTEETTTTQETTQATTTQATSLAG